MMRNIRCNRSTAAILIIGGLLMPILVGCMQVVRQEAPYFKKSQHQIEPPDGFFEAGTRVWVFGEEDSYARVMSLDGRAGHIWNRDLISIFEWDKIQKQAKLNEPKSGE